MQSALFIRYHAREELYMFADADGASKEMSAIESKIGKKWYGKNGDEENPTYRFKHATGEAAICLEKVESVGLSECDKVETSNDEAFDRSLAREVRQRTKKKQAFEDAGLIRNDSSNATPAVTE